MTNSDLKTLILMLKELGVTHYKNESVDISLDLRHTASKPSKTSKEVPPKKQESGDSAKLFYEMTADELDKLPD